MMKKSKDVDLGKDPIRHLLWVLALPAITSQVVNALYNMVDRMYIGHIPEIGATALTGMGICFPIIMIVSATSFLFGVGGAPRAGIFMGKKDNETAQKILGNGFTCLSIASVMITILLLLLLLFKEPLLMLFGASENTLPYAMQYISIYALGTIFVQLTLGMNAYIGTQGFSKVSMQTVLIGAITNIVLDPILIFGFNLGVKGAAIATVLSQALSALWALRFLTSEKSILKLKKENLRLEKEIVLPSLSLGIAPFMMQATESLLVHCFNSSLLKYGGDVAVGTMTILSSIMQFAMLPLMGLTQGGQPIMSYNYGAKQASRVKEAFKLQTTCCLIYTLILWAGIMVVPGVFVSIFTSDLTLHSYASQMARIYLSCLFVMGLQNSCQQAFIAFGNAKTSAFLAIFRKIIVLIPLIFILPLFFEDQVKAVFLAEPIADIIAVSVTSFLFYKEFKKMMRQMR